MFPFPLLLSSLFFRRSFMTSHMKLSGNLKYFLNKKVKRPFYEHVCSQLKMCDVTRICRKWQQTIKSAVLLANNVGWLPSWDQETKVVILEGLNLIVFLPWAPVNNPLCSSGFLYFLQQNLKKIFPYVIDYLYTRATPLFVQRGNQHICKIFRCLVFQVYWNEWKFSLNTFLNSSLKVGSGL